MIWLNLRYHWKALVGLGLGLVLLGGAWVAWANIERPDCRWHWDREYYHHRVSLGQIRWCLSGNHVNVNQQDEDGRTILHRIARDIHRSPRPYWFPSREHLGSRGPDAYGNTRSVRLAIVKEILRWKDQRGLDLDIVDNDGRTAFQYAVKKGEGRPMAALLLKAGAAFTLSPSTKQKAQEQVLPLIQAFGERFLNPFEGEIDFDGLFDCETTDCLLDETLKD